MSKKIFLLGVGAQKGGTTWLHSQLSKSDKVDMGFEKEYHVFDAVFSPECIGLKRNLINAMLNKDKNGKLGNNNDSGKFISKKMSFIDNTENYFDYFDYLYLKNDKVQLVGDITPSYGMLDSKAFQHIKDGLEARGFDVRVVFLMRDPLERIWSMLRMGQRETVKAGKKKYKSEEEALKGLYKSKAVSLRTRYDRTIVELEKVFDVKNIFYNFYEDLFTKETYQQLSTFLSLDLPEPDFDLKMNASPKTGDISESLKKEVVSNYREVYEFLNLKSKGHTKSIWSGYNYLP